MSIELECVESPTPDARALISELDAELNAGYSPQQRHGLSLEKVFQPWIRFFVARLDGKAAGCGGISFENGLAEIKRMYVRPDARRSGVALAILSRLEAEARARGFEHVVLETGDAQYAAIRFYERAGFGRCPAFEPYASMPAAAIERSRFFEKRIL
jgi:ribosomal protein S18 acetylase RimI-like enzyme